MDTFPDLGSLDDSELKDLIKELTDEETEISYKRRILHGKIDILRAELVNRLRKKHDGGEAGDHRRRRAAADRHPRRPSGRPSRPTASRPDGGRRRGSSVMALHCTECGFVNAEGANYCQRCGALLPRAEGTAWRSR